MTAQRARAYGQVTRLLKGLEPDGLSSEEKERVRSAADSLVFCHDLHADESARTAIVDLESLVRNLVDSGRWTKSQASALVWSVLACGPPEPVIHRPAA
jgi:hypothetical protein